MAEPAQRPRMARLPLAQVLQISWRNIRHRLARCLLAMGGIVLSVAFLAHVLSLAAIEAASGGEGLSVRQQWLITISLLACGVGIVNAMLMSVMERYREIGTIKCLGALDGLIVKLFLIEALIMGLLGSVLGVLLGWTLAVLTAATTLPGEVEIVWPLGRMAAHGGAALCVGLAITVLAAIYPSWRAARMVPADAMRAEV